MELGFHLVEAGVEVGIQPVSLSIRQKSSEVRNFFCMSWIMSLGITTQISSRPKGCTQGSYDMGS